ncbi:MAG: TetR family transcriptional regulator [Deltaproteobacteria bacterium]|nr:TetR family transcriptional regulator [Deltaproteobacteria bacterium]
MKPRPVTRERKKARTRDAIFRAAVELAERHGFDCTSIDDIAIAADISPRTFFRYFPAKDHVMFPYHADYVARFRELLRRSSTGGDPMAAVRAVLGEMADAYTAARADHVRLSRIISNSTALVARSVVLDADWETAIAAAFAGRGRVSAARARDAALRAGIVMGAVSAVMRAWYAGEGKGDLRAMGAAALDLVERGLGTR